MARKFRIPDTLPPLSGWVATLYVALWLPMLAIALVGVSGGTWYRLQEGASFAYGWHELGISIANDDTRVDHLGGGEVRAAGVRIGDRILSVDDIANPIGRTTDQFDWQLRMHMLQSRGPLRLVIQTGRAPPRTVMLTRSMAHGDALYAGTGLTPVTLSRTSALISLIAPASLIFGAILLFGRRRDSVAALLSISLLGLATGFSFSSLFWGNHLNAMWVFNIMVGIGTLGMLMAIQIFPTGRFVPRWTAWLAAVTPFAYAAGLIFPSLGTILVAAIVLIALVAMIVRYRREVPEARRQWRWAMIGFVTGLVLLIGAITADQNYLDSHQDFATNLWSWIMTPLILSIPATIIVAGVVLSVLRYRLYDTQAAISRSILYGGLTLTLLAIFAGSEKIVEVIGEQYFGESIGALAGGLGAAFAAVAIAPLHHRLGHWVEHRFRKNLIHLRHDLPPLLTELGETSDPATVARTVLHHLRHGLHATRGAVVAKGQILATAGIEPTMIDVPHMDGTMPSVGTILLHKRDPLFPVRIPLAADNDHWLLIGARPDASLYDRQERELLSDLAIPLAQALRISADRTSRDAAIAARIDRIEHELRALRADRHRIVTAE